MLSTILLQGVTLHDFGYLPSLAVDLQIEASIITAPSSGAVNGTGIGEYGLVVWDDIWTLLPLLSRLVLRDTRLRGELPSSFPSMLNDISLSMNFLCGTIPPSLFTEVLSANPTSLSFEAYSNELTWLIPSELFSPGSSAITSLNFNVAANFLVGSVPYDILHPFAGRNLTSFTFSVAGNGLGGTLPGDLFPINFLSDSMLPTAASTFDFRISSNQLEGTIPSTLFNFTGFSEFVFDASSNYLTGPLPSRLFPSDWKCTGNNGHFSVHLSGNNLNDSVPEAFFVGGLSANATFFWIDIDLSSNDFTGSLPSKLLHRSSDGTKKRDGAVNGDSNSISSFSSTSATSAGTTIYSISSDTIGLTLGYNNLEGSLPNNLLQYSSLNSKIMHLYFDIRESNISGPFPSDLLSNVRPTGGYPSVLVYASSTRLSGSPPSSCWQSPSAIFDFSSTSLNGTIPSSWQGCEFEQVILSDNPSLTSSLPSGLFAKMKSFTAANTPLSGPIPTLSSATRFLDLSNTNIDFCPSSPSPSQFTGRCMVYGSNACDCGYLYATCDNRCTPGELVTPPATPITPSVPTPSFSPTPTPPPNASCPNNTRPSSDFTCINGTWTATIVTAATLVIPTGAGKVIVTGNLNSTTVVLKDIGSSIEITGSASNLTTVTVELTPEQVAEIGDGQLRQSLITVASHNDTSGVIGLSSVAVNTRVTDGCKKVKAQKTLSDGNRTLGAVFSVDNSACNRWWIILVAVVAGIVVLAVIILVLLGIFCKPFRTKLRPYSEARERRTRTAHA